MANIKLIDLLCPASGCGYTFKAVHPSKTGRFTLTCPKCRNKLVVDVKGEEPDDIKVLGTLEQMQRQAEEIKKQVEAQKQNVQVSPTPPVPPTFPGKTSEKKPTPPPTVILDKTTTLKPQCKLVRISNGIPGVITLKQILTPGKYTVGRPDPTMHTDIPIAGDPEVSRNSAVIECVFDKTGFNYNFTLLRSTNPVFYNGQPFPEGSSVQMNIGDTLVLGRTQLQLRKN